MCKATRRSLLTLILVAGSMPALAQGPPPSVPFNGTMPEASLIFSLYHAPEEAVLLWVEMQIVAVGPTGAYDTLLGTTSPLPLELFGAGEARWVGVQVEGGEEQGGCCWSACPTPSRRETPTRSAGCRSPHSFGPGRSASSVWHRPSVWSW